MSRNNRRSVLTLVEHAEGHDPDPACPACAEPEPWETWDAQRVEFDTPWSQRDEDDHLEALGYFDPPVDVRT